MHTRPLPFLVPLLLLGALATGCDLFEQHPTPPTNQVPVLASAVATPAEVSSGNAVALMLDVSDPDGDALTYTWTQSPASPAGTFNDASAANPTWTAPEVTAETSFQLNIAVTDGRGGNARGSAVVKVLPPNNNPAPVLTSGPTASTPTLDEQQSLTLSVSATDADGDPLTYAWSQVSPTSPTGTFSDAASANTTWTAPDVGATGTYSLRVTVSDDKGGSVQGVVDITVRKLNRAPIVPDAITPPSSPLKAGDMATFQLAATDPDGDTLTYTWEQTAPASQGTWFSGRDASIAKWYSPVLTTETSFTFSVTVTDGESPAETRTLTVPVGVPGYADVQAVWNDARCADCHSGARRSLDLRPNTSYASLTTYAPTNPACNTFKTVEPNNPDASALVKKLEGTCGTRMPQDNQDYFVTQNPNYLVRVRSWIQAGANP
jgi:hypothetical protein